MPLPAAPPATIPPPVVVRRVARSRAIALAAAAAGVIAALALARHFVSGEEYDPADAFFASEAATTDHSSTVEPIASAPATPSVPAAATPAPPSTPAASATTAVVTPAVRPIASRQVVAEAASRKSGVEASAATTFAAPAVDTREPEETTAVATDAGPTEIAPLPATVVTTVPDEVTITGCLEIDTDQARFRLADTEGAAVPQARSWRSGFFKKRAAPVDLVGSADALSLPQQVGQRIAATGVLTSRTLKVSSVRVVAPSCN